jgi:hypothetical protein
VNGLNLALPPARPEKSGGLGPRKPAVARRALLRKGHPHAAAVEALLFVKVDGRAQVLEVPSSSAPIASGQSVFPAGATIDLGERSITEELVQAADPRSNLLKIQLAEGAIVHIDREDIGNLDLLDVALGSGRTVLAVDVISQAAFSTPNFFRSASRADLPSSVEDEPGTPLEDLPAVSARSAEPETGTFGLTRHASVISSIARSVV